MNFEIKNEVDMEKAVERYGEWPERGDWIVRVSPQLMQQVFMKPYIDEDGAAIAITRIDLFDKDGVVEALPIFNRVSEAIEGDSANSELIRNILKAFVARYQHAMRFGY